MLPSSSGLKSALSKKSAWSRFSLLHYWCLFLTSLTVQSWRWRLLDPPKGLLNFNGLYGFFISHKTLFFTATAIRPQVLHIALHSGGGGGFQTGSTRHVGHSLAYCTCPGWLWGWRIWWNEWQGKPKYSEKTCPGATLSTTNPTWPDPGLNPGRRGGKPATNRFSYGAAKSSISFHIQIISAEVGRFQNNIKVGYMHVTAHFTLSMVSVTANCDRSHSLRVSDIWDPDKTERGGGD
jgi:hypothetical protein